MNEEQATCIVTMKDLLDIYKEVYPDEIPSEEVLSDIIAAIGEDFAPIYNSAGSYPLHRNDGDEINEMYNLHLRCNLWATDP